MYKEIILNNQEKINSLSIIERNFKFDLEILKLNKIITFVWPRRAWKTYTMYQILNNLIKNKLIKLEQIVFIDFSEILEKNINFSEILENFYSIYPNLEPFFVFDEIQEIENFREWIIWLFNKWFKIFLSWSNSNLLSSEISTHFRWRIYEYFIFPLSFIEFLKFKSFELKKDYSTKQMWILKNYLNEYLTYWWYPEISLIENQNLKQSLLKNYFEILLYKDLIERYNIENQFVIKYLLKSLLLSNTKEISVNKIYNELKSQNIEVSKNTLYNYIEYIENIFFIKKLNNFHSLKWFYKSYLYDVWFTYSYKNKDDLWKNLENIVYLELLKNNEMIYYKKKSNEIDFFLPDKNLNIQVCYNLDDTNYKREISVLSNSKEENNILITFEQEDEININWKIIKVIPFYKWILI